MRIGVVNDVKIAVEILRRVIASSDHEIAWIAYNGEEAVQRCAEDTPDIVLMDLIMPVMDGVQATCEIMKKTPCAILVVTASVGGNASLVFEALGCGALDAARTPVMGANGSIEGADILLKKIDTIGKIVSNERHYKERKIPEARKTKSVKHPLVAIGSSTGGPKALAAILSNLPSSIGGSIVIVQHVDSQFAGSLAGWLNDQSRLNVTIAREGETPEKDTVYLAETNDHLTIDGNGGFHYTPDPSDYPYRPSVDVFFFSLERNWKSKGAAILLTGIGRDGAKGLLALRNAGWKTIAQDRKSSIVFGMPKSAIELGAASEILSPAEIAGALTTFFI